MIDEKKLIEVIKNVQEHMREKNVNPVPVDAREIFTLFIEMVEEQPKVGEWIPFKTRKIDDEERIVYGCDEMLECNLPDEYEDILVTYASGRVCSDVFLREGYECYLDSGAQFISEVVAWMPMPEPYKPEE